MGRRLFQCLQKRVGSSARDLVRLVDDIELRFQECGRELDALAQFPDIVDTTIAGGIDLDDIGRGAGIDRDTGSAMVARPRIRIGIETVDRFGQQTCGRRLAGASRSGEQIRMSDAIEPNRISERADDRLLPDQIACLEGLRPVFAIERLGRAK